MDALPAGLAGSTTALRIALVTETYPPEVNGVALTLARLVAGLRQRGHSVQLIRPRQGRTDVPTQSPDFTEVLAPGLPIPGYPGLRFGLPSRQSLQRLWSDQRPGVVHVATEGPLGAAAVAAARALGLPVSSGFHTNFQAYSRHYRLGWLRGLVSRHLRRFHNRTDLTLVPTHELARELIADGYRNVDVLARGVDTQLFSPTRRSPALRTTWGVAPESLVVAYVGRVAAEKNLSVVTAAFDAVRDRHPDARLLFVGDGPLLSRLERRHPQHIFAGLRRGEDLATHYASADLFLFPSLTETFGNVVPEAMASGLGVLAFNCAAAADLIEDGRNGRTVAAGDRQAFIEAAVALASDRRGLAQLGHQAATSASHLGWEHIHEGFSRKLTELQRAHQGRQPGRKRLAPVPDSAA